jgi:ribosome-associated protein
VAVDTKENMAEIANNIGGPAAEHKRFREELKLAQEYGCKLFVLVENTDGIEILEDVVRWENPRRVYSSKAIDGPRLCKAMKTMQERYGVTFLFCRPEDAGRVIKELLGGEHGER